MSSLCNETSLSGKTSLSKETSLSNETSNETSLLKDIATRIVSDVWEDRKKTFAFSTMIGNSLEGNCLSIWTKSKERSLQMKIEDGKVRFYLVCGKNCSFDGESSLSDAGRIASVYVNRYGVLDR